MQIWRNAIIKPRIESGGYSARVNLISTPTNNPEVNPLRLSTKFIRSDRRWRRGRELSRRSSFANSVVEARAYISKVLHESTRIRPARLHCKLYYEILFTMRRLRGQLILRLKMEYPLAIPMLVLIKYSHSRMYISRKAFSPSRKTDWLFWRAWNFGEILSLYLECTSLFIYIKIKIIATTL